ncbi:MAG: nucleotidyl transferase AbiEii/AbiGii toxin family protein [Thermoanaerobaculia bacterium]
MRLVQCLRPHLDACGARWALAGGFALVAWGSTRTTLDLDLVLGEEARVAVLRRLEGEGFETLFDSEGFTNLQHPDPALGRLDLIWVEGSTRERLFAAAVERTGPDGAPLLVTAPEHLVAMKVKAIKNRPSRVLRDGEDLRFLLASADIDQNQARETFARSGLLELYERLTAPP